MPSRKATSESAISIKPGDGLVNALALFPDLDWLQREFDMLYFLDFCSGLDALAVHQNIVFIGPVRSYDADVNPVVSALIKHEHPRQIMMSREKIIGSWDTVDALMSSPTTRELTTSVPRGWNIDEAGLIGALVGAVSDLIMDVALERELQVPLVLSAHQSPPYLNLKEVQQERRAFQELMGTLAEKYKSLAQIWAAARRKVDPDDELQLPPVAFEVLTKANKLEDLPTIALEIRDKYRKVRTRFAELDECLSAKDVSPQKKLVQAKRIERSFADLQKTTRADVLTTFISLPFRLAEFLDFKEIGNSGGPGVDWQKVAESLGDYLTSGIRRLYVRPLYATRKRYLTTPSQRMHEAVRCLFGHELNRDDFALARKYSEYVTRTRRSIWTI